MAVTRFILGSLTLAALVACGGGGGGGNSGAAAGGGSVVVDAPAVVTPLALTSSNYLAASQEVLVATDAVQTSSVLVTGVQTANPRAGFQFTQAQLAKLPAWVRDAPATVTGAIVSRSVACTHSGSLAISVQDQGQLNVLDKGDVIAVTANNCNEDGSFITGTFSMAVTAATSASIYTVNTTFSNLTTVSAAVTTILNGGVTMGLNVSSNTEYTATLQSNPSLAFTSTNFGGSPFSSTLSNFNATVHGYSGYVATSIDSCSLVNSNLGTLPVTCSTPQAFTRVAVDDYPSVGQMLIKGANGSKVRVTAQNYQTVLIELDANGDDIYELAVSKLWGDLF
ncbi:hypothetical protein os1_04910 [Comamonadaceae bacterium OS-1]|nr:hypothetical protein os1_04910 [Comamonadaceae bacterium OS-1]